MDPSPRIVILLARFPVWSEVFLYRELQAMARADPRIRVVALRSTGEPPPPGATIEGIETLESSAGPESGTEGPPRPALFRFPALATWASLVRNREVGKRLAQYCRDHDVRHLHAEFCDLPLLLARRAARRHRMSFSVGAHARDVFCCKYRLRGLLAPAEFATVCNSAVRDELLERAGLPAECLHLIHHGLNLEDWPFRERPARCRPVHLLWAGRLVPKKGVDLLLDALAQLRHRQWCLRVVGDGPERTHCRARARERRIADRISWEKPQAPHEIRHAMAEADALVLPARVAPDGDRDGIPNVALEAMASGLPVVATTTGGLRDVVAESTGWPANSATAADVATALETFFAASDEEVRTRAGDARSQIETHFDIRQTVQARIDLFDTHLRNAV